MNIPIQTDRPQDPRSVSPDPEQADLGQVEQVCPPRSLTELLHLHLSIQQGVVAGHSAQTLAAELCELVGRFVRGGLAMLMRLEESGRLRVLAAPGAAPSLISAIEDRLTLEGSGDAGDDDEAAGSQPGLQVLVEDINRSPRWAGARAAAEAVGIRACWSILIRQGNRVLGTFALCSLTPGHPGSATTRLLEQAAAIAGVILRLLDLQDEQAKQDKRQRRQTEKLGRLTGFHAMLSQVNQLAADRPDVTTLYQGICRIAVGQGGLRLAWIGAPDMSGAFQPLAAAGAAALLDEALAATNPREPGAESLSTIAWREARTVIRRRQVAAGGSSSTRRTVRRPGLSADVALPLMLRGTPQAVLHVYADAGTNFDGELIRLLEDLAVDVGRALEAIDQQHHLDRLSALHAALMTQGEMLLRARTDTEMLHQTCAHLAEGELFHVAWIAQPDENGKLRAVASAGLGIKPLAVLPLALDDKPPSLVVQCWHKGHTVVSNDMQNDPALAHYRDVIRSGDWGSGAIVPILRNGNQFAVLALGATQAGVFVPEVVALCERIAALLGRGLDEFDLKQTLENERRQQFYLARHDPLTDLPNRRRFEEHLGPVLAGARRHGRRLCVCIMDVDDFKSINDRYGHAAGDALLREVSHRLRETLRQSDMIARLGGDEFALAIDDQESVRALPRLLGRVSEAIAAPLDLDEHAGIRVGLSAGLAVFPEDGTDADLLLRRADAALYAAKAEKTGPGCNWRRWSDEIASTAPLSGIDDPYGAEAQGLLAATAGIWPEVAAEFVDAFYSAMTGQSLAAPILQALSPAEYAHLKDRQAAHLVDLMAASTDREAVRRMARKIGQVHALTGVDSVLMMHALGIYQRQLAQCLAMQKLRPSDRQKVMAVALARFQEDHAEQMEASAGTVAAYFDPSLFAARDTEAAWVDVVQAQLDALASLPGILSVRLLRPDASGTLETLASSSAAGFPYGGLDISDSDRATIDRTRPEGRGLLSEAWHGGQIASTVNYQTDPRTAPWHEAARRFGVRSAVAVPIPDLEGRPVAALIMFGAYPHQFESVWIRHVCSDQAQSLSLLWHRRQKREAAVVVPEKTAVTWRKRLFTDGLVTHYQPIVDLRTGRIERVEALFRLVLESGERISPKQFLPILGARALDSLFYRGLTQALEQIARWEAAGISLSVHVNLDPSTLCQPGCALWVRDALHQTGVKPERLFLDITERQGVETEDRLVGPAFATLDALGVGLVMDNVGSIRSNLHRLRTLPFRAIKLDRGLAGDMDASPERSVRFAGGLVQLGHELGINVLAEGLETADLVEAAAVLGADAGQGSALGTPMPADAVAGWVRDFVWTVKQDAPRTKLGALAAGWRMAGAPEGGGMTG